MLTEVNSPHSHDFSLSSTIYHRDANLQENDDRHVTCKNVCNLDCQVHTSSNACGQNKAVRFFPLFAKVNEIFFAELVCTSFKLCVELLLICDLHH